LIKITGKIGKNGFLFYKRDLCRIISKDIYRKIELERNKYNENRIKSIELEISQKINFVDESDNIKIKQSVDKLEVVFE
jgi:hypothetical protein